MKIIFFSAALLLAGSALLTPTAQAQNVQPAPPGSTLNPYPNSYNVDLSSLDDETYSFTPSTGPYPNWPFFNESHTNYSVSGMADITFLNLSYLLHNHNSGGTVTAPIPAAEATLTQNWMWEGPELSQSRPYQLAYIGSLGGIIHFDSPDGQAKLEGEFSHLPDAYTHSYSTTFNGPGTQLYDNVANDIYAHEGQDVITGTVMLKIKSSNASLTDPGTATLTGPVVNNGNIFMSSNFLLFAPADPTVDPNLPAQIGGGGTW